MCSFLSENEVKIELLACRGCLSTNVKLYNMFQYKLTDIYSEIIGVTAQDSSLPHHLCHICSTLLLKYSSFRIQCRNSEKLLDEATVKNKVITTETIDSLNRKLKQHKLHKSPTQTSEFLQDNNKYTFEIDIEPADDIKGEVNEEINVKNELSDSDSDNKVIEEVLLIDEPVKKQEFISNRTRKKTKLDTIRYRSIKPKVSPKPIVIKSQSKTDKTRAKSKETFKTKEKKKLMVKRKVCDDEFKRKGKKFETKENMADFEKVYNVEIQVLTRDQQMDDVNDRKNSVNYLTGPYRCDQCYKGYMNEDNLKKHYSLQHDPSKGDVVCEFCRFRYKDKRSLTQHQKSHRLKFICKQCKYVSRTTYNAKEHYKMHSGRMYDCKYCGKAYEKLTSYLGHMRVHHPDELMWCEVCGEPFVGEFGLNGHKKRAHRDLKLPPSCKCERCDTQFMNAPALATHETLHGDNCQDATSVPCVHCGQSRDTPTLLRVHMLKEHIIRKPFHCEKCNKSFTRESLYSAHYRRMHVEAKLRPRKDTPCVCEVCGKTLPNKCVLAYHQRNHTGERPYPCLQCHKSFTMHKLLQSHMRVHTTERPYVCKHCPKTFKGPSALRGHEQVHTGAASKSTSKTN